MIQIKFVKLHCDEETDEVGSDEPYVLVTTVNLASTINVNGVRVPFPAYQVFKYGPFDDVDEDETRFGPGGAGSFWGLDNEPAGLIDPDTAIFVVALMEHDNGSPEGLRGLMKGYASSSVFGTLTSTNRAFKVATLLKDVGAAMTMPTGGPNFDDRIGDPQELRFSRQELAAAEAGQVVTKMLVFEGDGGRYTLTFEAGRRVRLNALPGATITALLPFDGHVDLFGTSRADGAVWSTFFEAGRNWQNWFPIHGATRMKIGATVTPLLPFDGHVDLFATRDDGTVMSTFFEARGGWRDWFEIGSKTKMDAGAPVTVLQPFPGHVDLFATRHDGTVMSTFFEVDGGWRDWFPIAPRTRMRSGAPVTALMPFEGHVDLFAIRDDGVVVSTFFEANGGWRDWFEIRPNVRMMPGATVTALQPFEGHVDLFVTRADGINDGTVMSTFFDVAGGWRDWFAIGPASRMKPGATVTALQPFEGHVDLFSTRDDGTVMSTFFDVAGGWRDWFEIGTTKMHPGAPVTTLLPFEGHVDLFAVRNDGAVVTTFYDSNGGWREWFPVP